ncbi:hypothetical protein RBSWK_03728 [Rhodopirellula baltica SWK14]|uniref:Uncharacterized protein n=1 Tax=Rhodopirellula baltica SWK14 TaxID=993516 RepID=L7CFG2_RHOBT|nr:hypothetical protein RBSWK_03728 [Rhodopirellula baltica SWK14]
MATAGRSGALEPNSECTFGIVGGRIGRVKERIMRSVQGVV